MVFEFALLCYRCDGKWQTVPFINNPACKTVSSSAGSQGLMKQSNSLSWPSGKLKQLSCLQIFLVVEYFVGQNQIIS